MNKNYRNILKIMVICLAACNGLFGLEISGKACLPADKNPLKTAVKNYVLTYLALYSAIPVVSAGFIKTVGSAPLKNSLSDFKGMSFGVATKIAKTMPVAAVPFFGITLARHKYKQNIADKE